MTSIQKGPRRLARLWRKVTPDARQGSTEIADEISRGAVSIGQDVQALEVSAELRPASPASSKSVVAQVRFYDEAGKALEVRSPPLRHSDKVGSYFYPYDYMRGGTFRFVIPAPSGAAKAEVILRHWRKLDKTPYGAGALSIEPVDPIAAPQRAGAVVGEDEAWSAERVLRGAIKSYATTLAAGVDPLPGHEAPFGEAVAEHFIFETRDAKLARGLALRRLAAGRDRDALFLLPLVPDQRLLEAACRRALLDWAESFSLPVLERRLGDAGAVVLIAQERSPLIGESILSFFKEQDWPLEVFSADSPTGSLALGVWTAVEHLNGAEAGQAVRLADQVVRAGRGRDLRLVWASSARDALVAASVGRRLELPIVYEIGDAAEWIDRFNDAVWRSTDEGQREEALLRAALRTADRLVIQDEGQRAWLSMLTEGLDRIYCAGSELAMLNGLARGNQATGTASE